MSYRCGLDIGMAKLLGMDAGQPRLICDGCGAVRPVTKTNGMPYRWLLDNRKAPGWRMVKRVDQPRRDYCQSCPGETP
jgi:hypothetical protein